MTRWVQYVDQTIHFMQHNSDCIIFSCSHGLLIYVCVCACLEVCNVYMYVDSVIPLIRKHLLLLYTRVDVC